MTHNRPMTHSTHNTEGYGKHFTLKFRNTKYKQNYFKYRTPDTSFNESKILLGVNLLGVREFPGSAFPCTFWSWGVVPPNFQGKREKVE